MPSPLAAEKAIDPFSGRLTAVGYSQARRLVDIADLNGKHARVGQRAVRDRDLNVIVVIAVEISRRLEVRCLCKVEVAREINDELGSIGATGD